MEFEQKKEQRNARMAAIRKSVSANPILQAKTNRI